MHSYPSCGSWSVCLFADDWRHFCRSRCSLSVPSLPPATTAKLGILLLPIHDGVHRTSTSVKGAIRAAKESGIRRILVDSQAIDASAEDADGLILQDVEEGLDVVDFLHKLAGLPARID